MNVRTPSTDTAGFVDAVQNAPEPHPAAVALNIHRMPYRTPSERAVRNENIRRLRLAGMKLAEIGDLFDLTTSGVHHICSGRRGR